MERLCEWIKNVLYIARYSGWTDAYLIFNSDLSKPDTLAALKLFNKHTCSKYKVILIVQQYTEFSNNYLIDTIDKLMCPANFFTDEPGSTSAYVMRIQGGCRYYAAPERHQISLKGLQQLAAHWSKDKLMRRNCWMPLFRKYLRTLERAKAKKKRG